MNTAILFHYDNDKFMLIQKKNNVMVNPFFIFSFITLAMNELSKREKFSLREIFPAFSFF